MQGIIGEMLGQCMLGEYVEWVESVLVWGVVMCVCEMGVSSVIDEARGLVLVVVMTQTKVLGSRLR